MVLINQCYPGIFYSEFPIKTLTHNILNYKQLFGQTSQTKLQKVGYNQTKPANIYLSSLFANDAANPLGGATCSSSMHYWNESSILI